jgi:hypothetical protein
MIFGCILLDLPEVLFRTLRDQCLRTENIARLDSAFCDRQFRRHFTVLAYEESKVYAPGVTSTCKYVPFLRWVLTRATHIEELTVGKDLLHDDELRTKVLSANGQRLTTVRVNNYDFGDRSRRKIFTEIVRLCSNVKNVDITATASVASRVNHCLEVMTGGFEQLTSLTIAVNPSTASGMARALGYCKHLKRLLFTGTAKVNAGVAIPSLTYLDCRSAYVEADVLIAVGQCCPNLENLYVVSDFLCGAERHINDASVRAVLQGCPMLRGTDLYKSSLVSDELRVELAKRCDITELDFSTWDLVSNELAQDVLRLCPILTKLNFFDCGWLTDATLAVCAQHCPVLTAVAFYGSPLITNGGIHVLAAGLTNQLRSVALRACPRLSDGALLAFAEHCPLLEGVTCTLDVSDAAVVKLAEGCRELRYVDLNETQVGDAGLTALSTHCPTLRVLYLQGCRNVTMVGVRVLCERCSRLQRLMLPQHFRRLLLPRHDSGLAVHVCGRSG